MKTLTKAQVEALKMAKRRDWPAGEPRARWFHKNTLVVLLRAGLVVLRADPRAPDASLHWQFSPFVDLTPAGLSALQEKEGG